ncbi:MAG: NAD(P)H-dependent flavin oxidoreductase [Azovibrio sp.]
MHNSRISDLLGIKHPVIQASMVWITSAELVAAVSNAGGLGVLGPNAGKKTHTRDPVETAEALRQEIIKTKQLTQNPFAVNYLLPIEGMELSYRYAKEIFKVLCEEDVRIVITSGQGMGKGEAGIRQLKEAGFIVIHRDLSPTVESAIHFEKVGVDALIVTGHEAGGHLSEHRISTLALLPQVTSAVSLPVIAAGGIYNGKGAKAAFSMGAEGVYMGTRFINTVECPASDECKQEIINVRSEDLVELHSELGSVRITPNKKLQQAQASQAANVRDLENQMLRGIKAGMLDGDIENGVICVSESAGGITDILTCREVIEEIVAAF